MRRVESAAITQIRRQTFVDIGSMPTSNVLLLPEESCLAEDDNVTFHVYCERKGFNLFGWGDVSFTNIRAKVYLTNYRVAHLLDSR